MELFHEERSERRSQTGRKHSKRPKIPEIGSWRGQLIDCIAEKDENRYRPMLQRALREGVVNRPLFGELGVGSEQWLFLCVCHNHRYNTGDPSPSWLSSRPVGEFDP